MAGNYKSFMRLLESWPLDKTKVGSDLGQHIRDQLKIAFAKGDASQQNVEQCNRYYSSLKRISSNHYGQFYKRSLLSTASGLSREQCTLALTPEMLDYLKEEDKGIFRRAYGKIRNIVKYD
ncbi:ubiquinol-cytochrome-c reductase complex assembly factor 2 [Cataglyphis hispanica]|uniref:ubiquinol-cytochrome-c reductase complex assembly factor 2 n=1 Tax=Cataglyphis hispanica TaxID=1086592 RepID=UPI00217F46E8|nr:ubiquinol-cytochrome-c reductase complex assembly factor 2 [Cataglyphis hispanica]